MIGNDIVDLELSRKESNWKRKGFLEKIFTYQEQELIINDSNPELMVWNLWTRKESAYKIYNRCSGIKGFFPWNIDCNYENITLGTVTINEFVCYTQTFITNSYVYSIAVSEIALFSKIKPLETLENIKKQNGIPYIFGSATNIIIPVSITHHGRFQKIISL